VRAGRGLWAGRRRVWITGMGVVTPIGIGRDAFWAGLRAGYSPVRRIDRFDPSPFHSQVAAQVDDFEPLDHLQPAEAGATDRFGQFALTAARLALADAALTVGARGTPRADRFAVLIGSALGAIASVEAQHEGFMRHGIGSVEPHLARAILGGGAPSFLGAALGVHGPIVSMASSCASGAVALGEALRLIRDGDADAALAGGVEVPLSPLAFGAFDRIGALGAGHNGDPGHASCPFDADRDGFIMGEGAALLVLEEAGAAAARGASPYAELRGFAATSDAADRPLPANPHGLQAARAARLAMADARIKAPDIDYVNAHASSTPLGDVAEAVALRRALGPRGATVPVSGTKACYGHPLGASGAIEAAICALAISRAWAPGTVNLEQLDQRVAEALPGVRADPLPGPVGATLSTSFGLGGLNAALVLSACDAEGEERALP
jgi:3-oxoacyl-[acyl-carrier-protein] synthase II